MARLKLLLLGTPDIQLNDESVSADRRKAIALLAYLAVSREAHARDALATLLWPEYDQSSALAYLRRTLWEINDAIGDEWLDATRDQVALAAEADLFLDVAEFRRLAAQCQEVTPTACIPELEQAVSLYRGDFMAGFSLRDSLAFDEWQFFQAEALKQRLGSVLEQLIEAHSVRGEWEKAVAYGRHWLQLDPLNEPAHRLLMKVYTWAGQRTAALRQYEQCVQLLADAVSVAPDAATTALYEAIRSHQLTPPPGHLEQASGPEARFMEQRLLASGGHGSVFLGSDRLSGEQVVIKRLRPDMINQDPDLVERFRREGAALRQLDHPNIVRMLALYEAEGAQNLVMEYVPGGTLRELLSETKQLEVRRALDIALELADALSRAHHLGIIHRDVKPENVLLAKDGTPRLTDFGLARLSRLDVRVTQTGVLLGSPAYMSPEALRGEDLDARSDIWSLGVVLYEMVAGQRPFAGEQLTPVIMHILNEPPPDIFRLCPEMTAPLAELLTQMLEKTREARIASMRQVAAALEAIRDGRAGDLSLLTPVDLRSPAAAVAALQERGQAAEPAGVRHNLPPQPTPFLGREEELAEVNRLLDREGCNLLTLIGPGGIGKTRLALEIAMRRREQYADGVYLVPLASVEAQDEIVPAVANALDFRLVEEREPPRQQLFDYLRQKQMLLILDNYEHLLDGHTPLPSEIMRVAPDIKILATSRVRLNVQGEYLYSVPGLSTPRVEEAVTWLDPEQAAPFAAVQLFLEAARRVRPDFELSSDNLAFVTRICELVQGMPLAIELAASWMEILSPMEIALEIGKSLDFLEADLRDLPKRQRSIRAVFNSSWRLLSGDEQAAFRKLAIFRGSFDREAAEQIADASLRLQIALVNKSLLQRQEDGRFTVHELLRQYAEEALKADPAAWQAVQERHHDYYMTFLSRQKALLKGADEQLAYAAIESALPNVRRAWLTATRAQKVEHLENVFDALMVYFLMHGAPQELESWFDEGIPLLEAMANDRPGQILFARYLSLYAWIAAYDYVGEKPRRLAKQAVDLVKNIGSVADVGIAVALAARVYEWRISTAEAVALLRELVDSLRETADTWDRAFLLHQYGEALLDHGPPAEVLEVAAESLRLQRSIGNRRGMAYALSLRGSAFLVSRHYDEAEAHYLEAQELFESMGDRVGSARNLHWLGGADIVRGDYEQAMRHLEAARQLFAELGDRLEVAHAFAWESISARHAGHLEQALTRREEALRIYRELSDAGGIAWSYWELGEMRRLKEEYDQARQLYDRALEQFRRHKVQRGISFYHLGLGEVGLATDDYAEAEEHFLASLHLAESEDHTYGETIALNGLGRVAAARGENEAARNYFIRGLEHASRWSNKAIMLQSINGFAMVHVNEGQREEAVALANFVLKHQATYWETKREAAATLAQASSGLTEEVREAAEQQYAGETLALLVKRLLGR